MQRPHSKFIILFILLILSAFKTINAQTSSFRLKTADSLYQAKKYTQSFEHYQEILKQKQYSPAMLLKMAFIQEGLNNVGQAMYYLNLYHTVTEDKFVLEKMAELAEKYDLQGYETSDTDHFLTVYYDHYEYFTYALAVLTIFLLSLIFYTKVRLKQQPALAGTLMIVVLIGFVVHLNIGGRAPSGIIASSSTYIMNGPSPGSTLITIAGDGHRVKVIGKTDVWVKIEWDGETAYIRDNSLLPVRL
jgi:uncharacterized protein YgiM (DUF1202 family)